MMPGASPAPVRRQSQSLRQRSSSSQLVEDTSSTESSSKGNAHVDLGAAVRGVARIGGKVIRAGGKVMSAVGEIASGAGKVARVVGEEIEKIADDEQQISSKNLRVYKQQVKKSILENDNAK